MYLQLQHGKHNNRAWIKTKQKNVNVLNIVTTYAFTELYKKYASETIYFSFNDL